MQKEFIILKHDHMQKCFRDIKAQAQELLNHEQFNELVDVANKAELLKKSIKELGL